MVDIAIVGSGLMGTATSWPLTDNGHRVRLVGTHLDGDIIRSCREKRYHPTLKRTIPEGVTPFFVDEIEEALDGVEIIVSGVNSLGVHWIGRKLGPYLRPGQMVIAVTKGLEAAENGDLLILPDVVYSELPEGIRDQVSLAAIGGPCIAGELAGRRQTCVFFGSRDGEAVERLAAAFCTSYYHVWTTTDLQGLEFCVALKNACTLGVGLAAGMLERAGGVDNADAHMYNTAAALFAEGCTEIDRMVEIFGGTRSFAYGLPGAGDLYVTAQGGRTVRLGRLLGLGHSFAEAREMMAGETLEAAEIVRVLGEAFPKLTARGVIQPDDFPLLRALANVVLHGQPIDIPFDRFFA
ncbi:MAG: glycerol-3-phosphate dehydrogenase [Chloroflexi bacterium]|nr:glycerol-3-phosphate dehydrogenase [Chloroflexota bacterium]